MRGTMLFVPVSARTSSLRVVHRTVGSTIEVIFIYIYTRIVFVRPAVVW